MVGLPGWDRESNPTESSGLHHSELLPLPEQSVEGM